MEAYLDNSATTRPCDAAVQAVQQALTTVWHNPSALYRPALEDQRRVDAVRQQCLEAAGAGGQRLIFTGSGTEADNLAILGYLRGVRKSGTVLILQVEHPAVRACIPEITHLGHAVKEIPVDGEGVCDLEALENQMVPDTCLICVMQVNNETGAVQPLEEIVTLRNRLCPQAAVHVDGVQGFLRLPVRFNKLGIQSYAFSGHKIHACKGIGGLIVRKDHPLHPIVFGGGQEEGLRSGTENTPGILSLGAAVSAWPKDGAERMAALKETLWESLQTAIPRAIRNGQVPGAPHILNVSLPPVRSQTLLQALSADGVYVSAGSACSSHRQKTSPVLAAMGIQGERADSALRFSLSLYTSKEEIEYAVSRCAAHYQLLARYTRR